MRTKVTEEGLLIPKQMLEGVDEVEIRQERNVLVIVPINDHDPIWELGEDPIKDTITDASVTHDRYLYNSRATPNGWSKPTSRGKDDENHTDQDEMGI